MYKKIQSMHNDNINTIIMITNLQVKLLVRLTLYYQLLFPLQSVFWTFLLHCPSFNYTVNNVVIFKSNN